MASRRSKSSSHRIGEIKFRSGIYSSRSSYRCCCIGPGSSDGGEADVGVIPSLPLVSRVKTSEGATCGFLVVVAMVDVVVVAVMFVPTVGVEREGVDEGALNYWHCERWKGFFVSLPHQGCPLAYIV